MWLRLKVALTLIAAAMPAAAAWAADPAIQSAETSVRLGSVAGYDNFDSSGVRNTRLLGVTAGLSDLSPSPVQGDSFPDLYAAAAYSFSYGTWDAAQGWRYPSSTPFALHDNAYSNTAIVRLGLGRPVAGVMEAIPYIAAGYENWSRRSGGPAGYGGFYQSELLGGGLRFDVAASPTFILSASAEGFAMVGGSGLAPSQDLSGDFGANAEERVSLDADYRLSRTWHAYAGLGVNHLEYSGSKIAADETGAALGAALQIDSMFGIGYGF